MQVIALMAALLWGGAVADAPKGVVAGNPNAPITIEVFSDFQCPACKTVHEQTLTPLFRDYVVPGKVYLVHHDFPLQQHKYSREAASYANAAARFGVYEEVAANLFRTQVAWSANGQVEEAALTGLSPALAKKVKAAAKDPAIAVEIQQDVQLGQAAGIRQTPTMFVNHRGKRFPFSGTVNYGLLRSLLDDLLKK